MLTRLKKTRAGRFLQRLSRRRLIGAPLRRLAWALRQDWSNPAYWSAANRRHNRDQIAILARFQAETDRRG
jgi:hypothetical protein